MKKSHIIALLIMDVLFAFSISNTEKTKKEYNIKIKASPNTHTQDKDNKAYFKTTDYGTFSLSIKKNDDK